MNRYLNKERTCNLSYKIAFTAQILVLNKQSSCKTQQQQDTKKIKNHYECTGRTISTTPPICSTVGKKQNRSLKIGRGETIGHPNRIQSMKILEKSSPSLNLCHTLPCLPKKRLPKVTDYNPNRHTNREPTAISAASNPAHPSNQPAP